MMSLLASLQTPLLSPPLVSPTLRFRGSKFTAYQELALPHFPSGQQAIAVRRVRFRGTALMLWITGLTCCTQSPMPLTGVVFAMQIHQSKK